MHLGKISKLFLDKEYGSISTKGGVAVHFHKHCLLNCRFDELYENQEVEFQMQLTHKGYLGFEIRPWLAKDESKNGAKDVQGKSQGL